MFQMSRSKLSSVFVGIVLGASVLVSPAAANHPANSCVDVEPETSSGAVGTSFTLTATLRTLQNNACTGTPISSGQGQVTINFEITGPNAQPGTPDLSCSIGRNETSCTVSYTGTVTGEDSIQGWIDHDKDDVFDQDEPNDVVTRTWTAASNVLDCDDPTGPDTERETNPGSAGTASNEIYTCTATGANGAAAPAGTVVSGEVETAVNDPDATDGASYDTPDYTCTIGNNGSCQITVTQNETELGVAEICFWVGTAAQGGTLCGAEPTNENQAQAGGDSGNDLADQVEKTWAAGTTGVRLDCDPESAVNQIGTPHTINCQATDATGGNVANVQIDAEATGPNDPDAGDTPASPDFGCTTAQNGRCSFTHGTGGTGTTTATGVTVYRVWVDADGSNATFDGDATEGNNEVATPGTDAEPDDTDVVIKQWDDQPQPGPTCPGFENDQRNQVVGDAGDNILRGTAGPDIICGFGGDDIIEGLGGNDFLFGGGGSDIIKGGAGADFVRGGPGDDILKGGGGNDLLLGNAGNDVLDGGFGRDRCRGGTGRNVRRRCES